MKFTQLRGKFGRIAIAALCAGVLCGVPAWSQDAAPSGPPAGGPRGPGGPGMEKHELDMLTQKLSLTSDQQTQVKAILDDQGKQMQALREDTSTSREEKRPKMMAIRKSSQDKIRATLTDDQKTKYDAMIAEMQQRMQNRGQGSQPPPQ
ncbi:MAG: hypothetical protein PW789_14135 [Edaphobacter sp.]|uniref:hypothetical protein n=1 Tax=Edaphobacter sp. TaxID=1934404 RepID=UPI00239E66DD|nr:hypothetical protein [Edaphobacter sp.]MDE1177720.1 hypothetical protein [Edaphobacter sp.]